MFGNALLPLLASVAAAIASVSARFPSKAELHAKQAEAAARIRANRNGSKASAPKYSSSSWCVGCAAAETSVPRGRKVPSLSVTSFIALRPTLTVEIYRQVNT